MDVESLFRKMHAIYGSSWVNQWPNLETTRQAKAEWTEKLEPYSEDTIKRAVNNLDEHHPQRPPNLLQFARLCANETKVVNSRVCCKCGEPATAGGYFADYYCQEHHPIVQQGLRRFDELKRLTDKRARRSDYDPKQDGKMRAAGDA